MSEDTTSTETTENTESTESEDSITLTPRNYRQSLIPKPTSVLLLRLKKLKQSGKPNKSKQLKTPRMKVLSSQRCLKPIN